MQQYQQAVLNDSPFKLKQDLRSRMKELQEAIEKIKAVKNNRYIDSFSGIVARSNLILLSPNTTTQHETQSPGRNDAEFFSAFFEKMTS